MKLKIEDFRGKMFYISSIPEVFKWLLPKAKEYKFFITNKFNPNVDGVIEPRKNVLRDNVGDIVRRVSKKAFEHNIPYYSLEEVAGLFLDEAFSQCGFAMKQLSYTTASPQFYTCQKMEGMIYR